MKRPHLIGALAAALAAFPAAAQGLPQSGPPVPLDQPRLPPPPGERPPVSLSYSEDDRGLVRQGMVGTLPIAPHLSAGIGLFSVTDDSRKAPETRRSWSPMDVGRRTERVAAIGLKIRF